MGKIGEQSLKRNTANWMSGFNLVFNRGKGALTDIFVFSIIVNILQLTGPIFMIQIYDRVMSSRSMSTLAALTVLVVAMYIIMGIIDFARARMMAMSGRKRVAFYEPYVFGSQIDPKLWSKTPRNSTAFRELDAYSSVFQSPALLGYFDVLWIPVYVGAMFLFHPVMGVAAIVTAAILIVLALMQQLNSKKRQTEANKISQSAFDFANESVEGREVLAAQSMGASFEKIWRARRATAAVSLNDASRVSGFYTTLTKSLRMLFQSLMLALGAYLAIQGQISGGSIIAGSILLGRALAPIDMILGQWSVVQNASNAMNFLETLVEQTPEPQKQVEYANLTADLELLGLTVVDENRKFIVANVSARLPAGQALGVIGLSGSGKSTLARAILGLVPLASGEVKLGGVNREHIGTESFGKKIGYLPQEVKLFTGTIAQNIARMDESYQDADVIEAAKAANVHDLILTLGDGYNTMIEANKSTLSGGQKQRIALARALYLNPLLLVLDEPNSALDDMGSRALNAAIQKLKSRGGTAVIMTHRPSAIEATEQLLMIENGRTKAYGPRDEVLKSMVKNAPTIQKNIIEQKGKN